MICVCLGYGACSDTTHSGLCASNSERSSIVYGGNKRCLGFCWGNLLEYGHMKERGGSGRKF